MCFGCSKEPSHRDDSFEYPQHMFWLRKNKNNFHSYAVPWVVLWFVIVYPTKKETHTVQLVKLANQVLSIKCPLINKIDCNVS